MTFLQPLLREPHLSWALASEDGRLIAPRVEAAIDSASRKKGLLGRHDWTNAALVIAPCTAVHTLFMTFSIDVVFVDRSGRVLKTALAVPPWRLALAWGAFATIEMPAGTVTRTGLRPGDCLSLRPADPS